MTATFADTVYFIALVLPGDQHHGRVTALGGHIRKIVTTRYVLTELGAAFAPSPLRHLYLALIDQLEADPDVRIVAADDALFWDGIEFFRRRPDKDWSLTDCISFLVMDREGIRDALTADQHFTQAGFNALLR